MSVDPPDEEPPPPREDSYGASVSPALERQDPATKTIPRSNGEGGGDKSYLMPRERNNLEVAGSGLLRIPMLRPRDFAGITPTEIEYVVDKVVPRGNVTVAFATGGTGKTTMAFQLQAAMAAGTEWLGLKVAKGRSIGFYSELNENEVHLKYLQAVEGMLGPNREHWEGLDEAMRFFPCIDAGEDLHLFEVVSDFGNKWIQSTPRFDWIASEITKANADLCILDSAYDFFGDLPELVRSSVAHFLGGLHRLASSTGCAIVLWGHPSQRGMSEGHGYAGSTAWHDKPRSRIYMKREIDEITNKPSAVGVFQHMKSSWGPEIPDFNFSWDHEKKIFVRLVGNDNQDLFLEILEAMEADDAPPSPSINAKNYVIKAVVEHPLNNYRGKREMQDTQARNLYTKLIAQGHLKIGEIKGKNRIMRPAVLLVKKDTQEGYLDLS